LTGLQAALEGGIDVLDIGCGRGHAINLLARAFPRSRCAGYEMSAEAIGVARAEAGALQSGARFEVRDVAALDEPSSYDLITAFDVIHDQARPADVLKAVARALKPDGTFLMVDVRASSRLQGNLKHPMGPFVYGISTMHCMTVSLAQGGAGLGTAWGEETARAMLAEAGLARVAVHNLEDDPLNSYYVARKA
jgi:SAM-dependent methyltransferase